MKYAVIRPDGVIELRQGGDEPNDAILLSDSQYDRACAAENRTGLEAILSEVQP